jgi:hypothetical protein
VKVLVPQHRPERFITEIIKSYETHVDVHTSFQNFWLNDGNYDIIHLHWPEYLFKWDVPTDTELLLLARVLKEWQQKGTKIVVTRHNYLPHRPNAERYVPLYNLIYKTVDAVIHMGQHSEQEYKERYKELMPHNQIQAQIPHPIFTNYPHTITTEAARKALGIDQNTLVMLVFGSVRTAAEKNLILKAFGTIKQRNKLLLVPGWKFNKGKEPIYRWKWFKVKQSKKYRISQEFIPDEQVQYYFKAADFVFLPRVDTLNSGVPFLAAIFKTPIIGIDQGNIGEVLKCCGEGIKKEDVVSFFKKLNVSVLNKIPANYDMLYKNNQQEQIGWMHGLLFKQLVQRNTISKNN